MIILGLRKEIYGKEAKVLLDKFYNVVLPTYKEKTKTLSDAISDLPHLLPLDVPIKIEWQMNKSPSYLETVKEYEARDMNIDYTKVLDFDIASLNNGLSEEQNKRLFVTPFLDEIITLISVGLRNLFPK